MKPHYHTYIRRTHSPGVQTMTIVPDAKNPGQAKVWKWQRSGHAWSERQDSFYEENVTYHTLRCGHPACEDGFVGTD